MKLSFLGATGTVTGSKYLLETSDARVLVDCGLFQGLKELRLRNWARLPLDPSSIDAVILTHAHIDHSGYLPLLVREGFSGPVYCSEATADLCRILLPDSAHLQEEDANRANRYGYSKHHPALPLYTIKDAEVALTHLRPVSFGDFHSLSGELVFQLTHAGHILGAACVTVKNSQKTITFSGDLGRPEDPVMRPPAQIQQTDILLLESTYGDRLHETTAPLDQLEDVILRTIKRGGTLIIPAFAVGRAQSLLFLIHQLKEADRIPHMPVYLDSPMAISATELLHRHSSEHRLSRQTCNTMCHNVIYTKTVDQSKEIYSKNNNMPSIIVSASGMATGGRVLHHLKHFIENPNNTILFTGFQAEGTRGQRILQGEKTIRIHGYDYAVNAEIQILDNLSAHSDWQEIMEWLKGFREPPQETFITHGEASAARTLKERIEAELGWKVSVPEYLEEVEF
ncbi:MBL fold metallo-hydrolase RNA specificity domain-containing protein [Sneathiella limimaris]|uniref:MBL fold metallo-hydrolase RNA specificity domain-containing protein n=1 Tax=Sneathiella limimaris TaxID=1964213 RepID=UPI00146C1E02|nr:MBL fold metallo-hydrolase [Sneathiella limimaris]